MDKHKITFLLLLMESLVAKQILYEVQNLSAIHNDYVV